MTLTHLRQVEAGLEDVFVSLLGKGEVSSVR